MTVPSPLLADKNERRRLMRERRRDYAVSLAPQTRAALEQQIADALEPLLFKASSVAAYFPMKDEASALPAFERARAMGKVTALPAFTDRDSRMTFRVGEPTDPGPWGILQPDSAAPTVSPDLLLVPLIAIDQRGNRIGMGKGHYDRALAGLRAAGATLVGIGWDFQMVDEPFTPDPWDVPLDGFASPSGYQEFVRA